MKFETAKKRLRQVVAAYGADPRRWPEDERESLARAASDEAASDWMIEARALDRVLERGAEAQSRPMLDAGLADAILARAATTPQVRMDGQAPDRQVIDFAAVATVKAMAKPGRFTRYVRHLPEAAVLAASLLIGFWAGGIEVIDSEIMEFSQVAGLTTTSEEESNFINALVGLDLAEGEDLL